MSAGDISLNYIDVKGRGMRSASRYFNIAWIAGQLYFMTLLTSSFMLDFIKQYLMMKPGMLCFAFILLMMAAGMTAFVYINRFNIAQRVDAVITTISIPAYILGFCCAFIAPSVVKFIICSALCALSLGYNVAHLNYALMGALHQDKHSGLATGLACVICGGLLTLSQALDRRLLMAVLGFVVVFYLYCRQPSKLFSARERRLRSNLNIVVTKRAAFNQLLMVAMIGISCSAALSLFLPIYNTPSVHMLLLPAVFCGLGMLCAGLMRDMMNRYMMMMPFCALCALMVCSLGYTYNDNFWLMAVGGFFRGAGIEYFICESIDTPARKRYTPYMLNICCIVLIGAIAFGLIPFSFVAALPDGRNILLSFKALPLLFTLVMMFFDSLYKQTQEPEVSFEIRLKVFCDKNGLTSRESDVLDAVLTSEKALKELASELYISASTLEKHMTSIYSKTGTKSRNELNYMFFDYAGNEGKNE